MVKKYKSGKLHIEALQVEENNTSDIISFIGQDNYEEVFIRPGYRDEDIFEGYIRTPNGFMELTFEYFIIKYPNGDFYPCHPKIFNKAFTEIKKDK